MSVTYALLYWHSSLNFTTSGLLLQCFVSMKNSNWAPDNSSIWEAWRTTNPHGSSPERILHPNYYRLFKLWEIIHLRGITVSWLHDMKFYTDLHSSCDNVHSFYHRGINLMQAKNHSNKPCSAEEWQLKNILNSLSHIYCDCTYFYKYVALSVFGQMHYWHDVYFLINWVHFHGKKKVSLGGCKEYCKTAIMKKHFRKRDPGHPFSLSHSILCKEDRPRRSFFPVCCSLPKPIPSSSLPQAEAPSLRVLLFLPNPF